MQNNVIFRVGQSHLVDEIELYNGYRIQNTRDEYGQYNTIHIQLKNKLDQFMIALKHKDVKKLFKMSELNKEYSLFCYGITYPETENHISSPKYLHQKDLKNIYDLLSPFTPVICCKLIHDDENKSVPAYYRIDCSLTFTSSKNKLCLNGPEFNITAAHIETLYEKAIVELADTHGQVKEHAHLDIEVPANIISDSMGVVSIDNNTDTEVGESTSIRIDGIGTATLTSTPTPVPSNPIEAEGEGAATPATPVENVVKATDYDNITIKGEGEATITSTPASPIQAEDNVNVKGNLSIIKPKSTQPPSKSQKSLFSRIPTLFPNKNKRPEYETLPPSTSTPTPSTPTHTTSTSPSKSQKSLFSRIPTLFPNKNKRPEYETLPLSTSTPTPSMSKHTKSLSTLTNPNTHIYEAFPFGHFPTHTTSPSTSSTKYEKPNPNVETDTSFGGGGKILSLKHKRRKQKNLIKVENIGETSKKRTMKIGH